VVNLLKFAEWQPPFERKEFYGRMINTGYVNKFENYAQFDIWTDDLRTLGFDLYNIQRGVLREDIQEVKK
jgi:hypothetical protein